MTSDDRRATPSRTEPLRHARLLDASPEDAFDRYTRLACQLLGTPISLVSLIADARQYVKSAHGLPDGAAREFPLAASCCRHVVTAGQPVVAADAREHPGLRDAAALAGVDVVAYLGVPLRMPGGDVVGSFCVIGHEERAWRDEEVEQVRTLAGAVVTEIALRLKAWEQEQVQARLRESEARLRVATAAAGVGTFETNVQTGEQHWSDQTCAIYGVPAGSCIDLDTFFGLIHPDDRARLRRHLEHASDPVTGGRVDMQHRIVVNDGEERYVAARGEVFFEEIDGERRPVRVLGTVMDVTQSRLREEMLRERTARLELALRAAGMGTWDYDLHTGEVIWSPETERIFGLEPGTFEGAAQHYFALIHPEDRVDVQREAEVPRSPGDEVLDLKYRVVHPDGTVRWLHSSGRLYRNSAGVPHRMIGTTVDVTDRHRYEDGLHEARERAEEMSRLKSAFLANMSHEIRTPLTSIIGFSEVLAEDYAGEGDEMVSMIRKSAQRLLGTLNSVLDLAQLDAGTLALAPEVEDLGRLTRESTDILAQQAEQQGLDLCVRIGEAPVGARVDRSAYHRVVTNLLANALKFTEEGRVTVDVAAVDDSAVVRVEDTGIGIDPDFLPHLFDEFRQESVGHSRTHEGNGLGLAITRQLVGLMDGEIEVESVKGEGSVFTVTFPLCEVTDSVAWDAPRGTTSVTDRRLSVLVVEDHSETRRLLRELLAPAADVILADDYASALTIAQRQHFDAALIDIQLGGAESGVDVMRALRQMPEHAATTLVACTAYALPGDSHSFMQQGFDAYISKPFVKETLLQALRAQLTHKLPAGD